METLCNFFCSKSFYLAFKTIIRQFDAQQFREDTGENKQTLGDKKKAKKNQTAEKFELSFWFETRMQGP